MYLMRNIAIKYRRIILFKIKEFLESILSSMKYFYLQKYQELQHEFRPVWGGQAVSGSWSTKMIGLTY